MFKFILLFFSHALVFAAGLAVSAYFLPILIAPEAPKRTEIIPMKNAASYRATFLPNLKGSDWLHWGRGTVFIGEGKVAFLGELAPGPDYKLYLAPKPVEDKAEFLAVKAQSLRVGDVKTFNNFVLPLPEGTDLASYQSLVVWCEAFSMFITAAEYRPAT